MKLSNVGLVVNISFVSRCFTSYKQLITHQHTSGRNPYDKNNNLDANKMGPAFKMKRGEKRLFLQIMIKAFLFCFKNICT